MSHPRNGVQYEFLPLHYLLNFKYRNGTDTVLFYSTVGIIIRKSNSLCFKLRLVVITQCIHLLPMGLAPSLVLFSFRLLVGLKDFRVFISTSIVQSDLLYSCRLHALCVTGSSEKDSFIMV